MFSLDILSHRMSEIEIFRQLCSTGGWSTWRLSSSACCFLESFLRGREQLSQGSGDHLHTARTVRTGSRFLRALCHPFAATRSSLEYESVITDYTGVL